MRRLILVVCTLLLVSNGYPANLTVDATKKKSATIIHPEALKRKSAPGIQNKRFKSKKLESSAVIYGDAQISIPTRKPDESLSGMNSREAKITEGVSNKDLPLRDEKIRFSSEFEKAYQSALKVELSKRAAAQVEVQKNRKKASQRAINKDSKVRKSGQDGFKVQQAGGNADPTGGG